MRFISPATSIKIPGGDDEVYYTNAIYKSKSKSKSYRCVNSKALTAFQLGPPASKSYNKSRK